MSQIASDSSPRPRRSLSIIIQACSLILLAFNLRPVFSSLSVLLGDITLYFGMSGFAAGILTTLPVLCLGIFAPLAPWLANRMGIERALMLALVLLLIGSLMRGVGVFSLLYIGAIFAGAAIAIGNVLLPGIVKRDFPHKMALMTGLYTMAVCGGAAAAAAYTVPLKHLFGGRWQLALGFWAIPVVIVMILWITQLRHASVPSKASRKRVQGLWRDPIAWQTTLFMGFQSGIAYSIFGWLAPIITSRGVPIETAGFLVSLSIMVQVVSSLLAPIIAMRFSTQSVLNLTLGVFSLTGILGFLFLPVSSFYIWVVVQGIGQGALLSAAMSVVVLRSHNALVASHLASMSQCVGYCIAAFAPLMVGIVHDWTGGYQATSVVFIVFAAAIMVFGWLCGRAIYVKAEVIDTSNGDHKV